MIYKGYHLTETTTGGRAGKGFNKTASIKVMKDGQMHGGYFRFWKAFEVSKKFAIEKAKNYIDYELLRNDVTRKTA